MPGTRHRDVPFSAVLSLTEQELLPAARIGEALAIPGLPVEVVARSRDKHAMRTWLRRQGFSTLPCAIVTSPADILAFATENGYPVIVKPRHGQGSRHVRCFRRADEVVLPARSSRSRRSAVPVSTSSSRSPPK